MDIIERLLAGLTTDGPVVDVRIGALWTAVAVQTPAGLRVGLASTQMARDVEHRRPLVRDAGALAGRAARELARLALPAGGVDGPTLTERCLGFAAINALIEVDEAACTERNAADIVLERGAGRRVAIVGHFPFVPEVRAAAGTCWVLELEPGAGDLPAAQAAQVLPKADVIAITAQTLVNGTLDGLLALCPPQAYVLLLGPTTPLSPLLFELGVDALSGTLVLDAPRVLAAVGQGANFRQIAGRKLVTMVARA
jgi:uncharacterized protein